ncbi:MAG: hypothetical protein B7Y80_14065 [Hyphomicrobium sp. 32-62-53]|nr:MAG: hypothetical protein B7Z29_07615 [Hyphomicrobium sp. 12-62-95]OYX98833.1 MAG: hypothetical protein B7Y80_14065 [Hyphomicrobium sp. 32-62-53]
MNRFILSIATAAIASATFVGGAQANTIWRFPYKSAPFAVSHDHGTPQAATAIGHPAARHIYKQRHYALGLPPVRTPMSC